MQTAICYEMSVNVPVGTGSCSGTQLDINTELRTFGHKLPRLYRLVECWNFNSGNYLFTTDTKQIHVSKFYCPSV